MAANRAGGGARPENRQNTRRLHLPEVDSTNDEALRRATSGEGAPFWLTADRQTGGKGRRGRSWISDGGNLFATLVYPAGLLPAEIGRLPLVTAVVVHATLGNLLAENADLKIKWPNDVLIGGRKISGILIEQHQIGDQALVAIGIGINIQSRPEIENYPTACLADWRADLTADLVWSELDHQFARWIAVWSAENGFGSVRTQWLLHAAGFGEAIVIAGEKGSKAGIFDSLDENGYLILRHDDGSVERIATGDVILKRSGTPT